MKKFISRALLPVAALGMAAAPVIAQAAEGEISRQASPVAKAENFAADGTAYILFGFLLALGALIATGGDKENLPTSP